MKKKYKITLLIISLCLFSAVGMATSYALWVVTKTQESTNVVESGCFDLEMPDLEQENLINLPNTYPMSNEKGLKLTPYTFNIRNTCTISAKYEVNLELLAGTDIDYSRINSSVNYGEVKALDSWGNASIVETGSIASKNIADGILAPNDVVSYSFSIWIDESVTMEGDDLTTVVDKTLKAKIFVETAATMEEAYVEPALNGADPVLSDELIPVSIATNGTVRKTSTNSSWYDYENKKWANAVMLVDDSVSYSVGQEIPQSNIKSYFVWIPRFKYKLFFDSNYANNYDSTIPDGVTVPNVEIVFENKTTTVSSSTNVGEWLTHPAFTAFDKNGIWISKFEATGTTSNITSKPGVEALRTQDAGEMFLAAKNYKSLISSHMMKNSEWGAVALLASSNYGINKKININNNSDGLTGYGAVIKQEGVNETTEYGNTNALTQAWNTYYGFSASTTGNITGIYDMCGGNAEYVAGLIPEQSADQSSLTGDVSSTYGAQYFDIYPSSSTVTSYSNGILGDMTGEIGPFYHYEDSDTNVRYHNKWYASNSNFVSSTTPWFVRGGKYSDGTIASQFAFDGATGGFGGYTFRIVLAP